MTRECFLRVRFFRNRSANGLFLSFFTHLDDVVSGYYRIMFRASKCEIVSRWLAVAPRAGWPFKGRSGVNAGLNAEASVTSTLRRLPMGQIHRRSRAGKKGGAARCRLIDGSQKSPCIR